MLWRWDFKAAVATAIASAVLLRHYTGDAAMYDSDSTLPLITWLYGCI
jgi:hypothetical protein